MNNYVPGVGWAEAKLAFIGEAPGAVEDRTGEPFTGPAGDVLDRNLTELNLSRSEVWITNIHKYKLEDNDFSTIPDLEADLKSLFDELDEVGVNCLVLLGDNVLQAIAGKKGITNWRGSILKVRRGYKAIPTFHPAKMLYSGFKPYEELLMRRDMQRALRESYNKRIPQINNTTQICRDARHLYEFIRREKNKELVATDIEVIKSVPVCTGIGFNRHRAMVVPMWREVMGIKLTDMSLTELAKCQKMLAKVFLNSRVIGSNFKFDQEKLEALGHRFKGIHADIQLMAHTIDPELPKSLSFNTSLYTELPYYKDEGREFNPKYDDIEDFYDYCGKDAHATFTCYEEMLKVLEADGLEDFFFNFVMKAYPLYYQMNLNGLKIDFEKKAELIVKYLKWWREEQEKFNHLCGKPTNVKSAPQIKELFLKYGLKLKSTGADDLINYLVTDNAGDAEKLMRSVILIRKIRDNYRRYIYVHPDLDMRMRTFFKQDGTETGRTSTGLLDPPIRPFNVGKAFQTITKHGNVGTDVRYQYVPDPGYCFVEVDSAQAEARVVALLAEDYELLEKLKDSKFDMHNYTLPMVFPGEDWSKERRQMSKTVRHAGNYDIQAYQLVKTIQTDAYAYGELKYISMKFAEEVLYNFHAANPKTRRNFHTQVIDFIFENHFITTPQGRKRTFYSELNEQTYKEAYAFIPQATVSDNIKLTMIDFYKERPDVKLLMELHDGLLYLVKVEEVQTVAKRLIELMERPINFKKCSLSRDYDLVIPAEASVGYNNWKEMEELELDSKSN